MTDKNKAKSSNSHGQLLGISIVGKIVGLLVIIWLVSISYYAFAFFMLGMLPAIVAIIIDRGAGRFASQTVTVCNFTGILPFLFEIGANYDKSMAARNAMMDPVTWLVVYGFAAIGWVLIWILPQVTMILFSIKADMQTTRLKKEQKELIEEWGEEVTQGPRTTKNSSI